MNTHILIPIKDIKDIIKSHKKDIDTSERGGDNIRAAAFTHIIDGLETAAKLGKQISLDEKDTETKAILNAPIDSPEEPAYPNHSDTDIFISGYKQALKDLL